MSVSAPGMKRRMAIGTAVLALGAAGYAALRYARVDHPRYPLPPDDPRCPHAMAYIPAGIGRIYQDVTSDGSPDDPAIEPRVLNMHIEAFCLDRNEVTVADYDACVRAGQCPIPKVPTHSNPKKCNYGTERVNHPINCISWDEARAYCVTQAKRLPLEEEWEYAAQGGEAHNHYPWGDATESLGRACPADYRRSTCAVRSFPAESFGLFDMAGNVAEPTMHPCTLDRQCNPKYAPRSGGTWADDESSRGPWGDVWEPADPFSERTRKHASAKTGLSFNGVRCAK